MGSVSMSLNSNESSTSQTFHELNDLNDVKKFKPTKRQPSSVLKYIFRNLYDVIHEYILVRKLVAGKTVKTYIYLVFKDSVDLKHMKYLVHNSVPYIEIDRKCTNPHCTCKTCPSTIEKGRKRRGFGYISVSDLSKTVSRLQNSGFTCMIKKPSIFKTIKRRIVRNPTKRFKCEECGFECSSYYGYTSHNRKHQNADSQHISSFC